MKTAAKTSLQLQLDFTNITKGRAVEIDTDGSLNAPSIETPHLSIHVYEKLKPTSSTRLLRDKGTALHPVDEPDLFNQTIKEGRLSSKELSKSFDEHLQQHHEIGIKLNLAKQLVDWMMQDGLTLEELSAKTRLSIEKVDALMNGNAKKVQLYELLFALTQFGYQALICFRRTTNQLSHQLPHQLASPIELEWQ